MGAPRVPIANARDVNLKQNVGTLPNMSSALLDWMQPILAVQVVKTQVNYQTVERGDPISFQGVIQPSNGRQLRILPDGQRSWDWEILHSLTNLGLKTDDVIWIQDIAYRVLNAKNLKVYGFFYYELQQDYQDRTTAPPVPSADAEKFTHDYALTKNQTLVVDVSSTITDAFACIWKLYDLNDANAPVIGAITVISETQVQILAPAASNYRLNGVG